MSLNGGGDLYISYVRAISVCLMCMLTVDRWHSWSWGEIVLRRWLISVTSTMTCRRDTFARPQPARSSSKLPSRQRASSRDWCDIIHFSLITKRIRRMTLPWVSFWALASCSVLVLIDLFFIVLLFCYFIASFVLHLTIFLHENLS